MDAQNVLNESKQLANEAKNIYIVHSADSGPDSAAAALALFYTLKEMGKNVNLAIEELPENLKFLIPSLDFISYPKNFVISIPEKTARISQIYYEKDEQGLKVHLTLEGGVIKKEEVSFYYSEARPDLVITVGIKDFKNQMAEKMDPFGFLLDSPILNIDNKNTEEETANKNFGKINLIRASSLSEIALDLIKNPHLDSIKKEAADCFLAGIAAYTENFSNSKIAPETFEAASLLMRKGADLQTIRNNLFKNGTGI